MDLYHSIGYINVYGTYIKGACTFGHQRMHALLVAEGWCAIGRRRVRALLVAEGRVRYWSPKGACAIGPRRGRALLVAEGRVRFLCS